jgi:MerR family transcriptional regulator, thiopeptide resistance regulator
MKTDGPWRVGELAKVTGLTVKTLHHYDEIDLLEPSGHTDAGHRLYTKKDLARLQQVLSLKSLGLSLDKIGDALKDPVKWSAHHVVKLQIEKTRQQLTEQRQLLERLEGFARLLESKGADEVSAAQFIDVMEAMTMIETFYSKEQLEQLAQRKEQVGEARIKEVEASWPRLMAEVRIQMEKGTDPNDPVVQALAKRWSGLLAEFTGGDPGIERSLKTMYLSEPTAPQKFGMPPDMMRLSEYIRKASVAK